MPVRIEAKENKTTDTQLIEQIDRLNQESWAMNRTNPQQGLELASEALKQSLEANYLEGVAIARGNKAACHLWLSNYTQALDLALKAQHELHALNLLQRETEILYVISVVYYFLGDLDKQLTFCFKSLELAEQIGYKAGMANALNGIGTVYYSNQQNEKALEYLQQGLEICGEIGERHVEVRILDGLGEANYNLQQYQTALDFKTRSLAVARELNIKQVESYALTGLGTIYLALDRVPESEKHYKEAIRVRQEMGFRTGEAQTTLLLGKAYLVNGRYDEALQMTTRALEISEETGAKETIWKAHQLLSEIYEKEGNLDRFAHHIKAYHQYHLQFSSDKAVQKMKSVELENQMSRISQEHQLLLEKNSALERYMHDMKILERIGRELLGTLSLQDILNVVYEQVNSMMDASVFAIGLYDESARKLHMDFAIEKGVLMPPIALCMDKDADRIGMWVVRNRKEAILNDVAKDISQFTNKQGYTAYVGELPESIIYLPLLAKEHLVGIITVQSFSRKAYSEYQVSLLRNLAIYAASAIENANLYKNLEAKVEERTSEVTHQKEEIERNHRSAQLLSEIGQQLISTLDIEAVFEHLHRNVNELMDASCFGIRLYDPQKNVVNYKFEMENGIRHEEVEVSMDHHNNYSVWCIRNKKPIHLNDNANEYHRYVDSIMVVSGDMPHSLLFQPLMKGEEVLGVITVQSFSKHAYTAYHLNILKTLASYTVIAIENARQYEKMERKVAERTADIVRLSDIGQQIISHLSIEKINEVIYQHLTEMMDTGGFGIGVYDKHTGILQFPGYIEEGKLLTGSTFTLDEVDRMAVACFTRELEILIGDYQAEHGRYVKQNPSPKAGRSVTSLIYMPLWVKGEKVGVVTVQSFNRNAYTTYHFNILKTLASYAAIAIENARLYEGLEEMVEERTAEVVKQKEEIEKNHRNTELLSQIGKVITSSLSIPDIVANVYQNINTLMDATCFGIGVYEPGQQAILMPGFYENGQRMEDFSYPLSDPNRLAVQCFSGRKEIFTNNYFEDFSRFIKGLQKPVSGKDSTSVIYIPVFSKDKAIGVITAQSFEANAYTDYHLNLLRNLAVYVGIALENATLYLNLEEKVRERTREVIEQKEIIEEKNKSITDSIRYAKRIQDATLPDQSIISQVFTDSFILFRPKDIVSGDFYWFESFTDSNGREKSLFAVVDCTGHGVPGAFMSIIGHNALNQIVHEYGITTPALILDKLNQILKDSLVSKAEPGQIQLRDGMDIALCCYHKEEKILEFAGAFNPLYLIRNGELQEFKGDKVAIGAGVSDDSGTVTHYHNHLISLQQDDRIVIFSDGYADQFGGPNGKKFKYTRFKEYLLEIQEQPMQHQMRMLDKMFDEWKGDLDQIDDVCIMGVKVA
jgi:GAF domain-containing protein